MLGEAITAVAPGWFEEEDAAIVISARAIATGRATARRIDLRPVHGLPRDDALRIRSSGDRQRQ
jgi:hypothetical protein